MSTNILILGLGSLGLPVAFHLATHPSRPPKSTTTTTSITVTTSRPLPSHLLNLGITSFLLTNISQSSPSDLASIFSAYDTIISCTGMSLSAGSQRKIAEAVILSRKTGGKVKRYIPWQFGLDYDEIGRGSVMPLFDEQVDVRDMLRAQQGGGVEWVVVSTGVFVGFLFQGAWDVVQRQGEDEKGCQEGGEGRYVIHALGTWDNRVTVTDEEGIGKCVAEVVWGKRAWEEVRNSAVKVAGDCVSYGEVADVVERVTRKKVRREVWSKEHLREEVKRDPDDILKRYRAVFAEGKGVAWPVKGTFSQRRGLDLMGVEEWARRNFK